MRILVSTVVKSCDYTKESFFKVLTRNGINNRFELEKDDLLKLHKNERVVSNHSLSLRIYLDELLKDELLKVQS